MGFYTVALERPFLDEIVGQWLRESAVGSLGRGLIIVPTRRAKKNLNQAFLRLLKGRPALTPAVVSVADLEEEIPLAPAFEARLPPVIGNVSRLIVLGRLIGAYQKETGQEKEMPGIERLWPLAESLADLLDEADRSGVDLAEGIEKARQETAAPGLARHWEETGRFLEIVTRSWPEFLRERGLLDPVRRQICILEHLAQLWREKRPLGKIWAVGFGDGSQGIARLLQSIGGLESGKVVFQGLDQQLSGEAWENLPLTHPQYLFREMLEALEIRRSEVQPWPESGPVSADGMTAFWRSVLHPAGGWERERRTLLSPPAGLFLMEAETARQEATAIAIALRDGLTRAKPDGTPFRVALVTPDRHLARRVRGELARFGVFADDSGGEALANTPPGAFLSLLLGAVRDGLRPISLLALLKHPLLRLGYSPQEVRSRARLLERMLLRGRTLSMGMEGLFQALEEEGRSEKSVWSRGQRQAVRELLDRLSHAIAPLWALRDRKETMQRLLQGLIEAAERLNDGGDSPGGNALWLGEDGVACSRFLADLLAGFSSERDTFVSGQDLDGLEVFLSAGMKREFARGLMGFQSGEQVAHPSVFILGVMEARLISFDLVVLGGLNEGTWPAQVQGGGWISRSMRKAAGLLPLERKLSESARDFVAACCAGSEVIMSRAKRNGSEPQVRAPWLVRAGAVLQKGTGFPVPPALHWESRLDQPENAPVPARRPVPRPPVAVRPRTLSVTQIDTLKIAPYGIYAGKILNLAPLPPLEPDWEYLDFGNLVHRGLERFFKKHPGQWPENGAQILKSLFLEEMQKVTAEKTMKDWWEPRLHYLAIRVEEEERKFSETDGSKRTWCEKRLSWELEDLDGGPFLLKGFADRIDEIEDANGARSLRLIDYKTGALPSGSDVNAGFYSQLPLEAAALEAGKIEDIAAGKVSSLQYWQMKGDYSTGLKIRAWGQEADLSAWCTETAKNLHILLNRYDDPAQPYWPALFPAWEKSTDYNLLCRRAEWASGEESAS